MKPKRISVYIGPKTGKKLTPEELRIARAIPSWRRSPIRPYPREGQPR